MNFWLISLLLTLFVAFICFYPLLSNRREKADSLKRDELNKAFYFNRLKEIEEDEQRGLLENSQQLKTELQQALLEDIPKKSNAEKTNKHYGKIWFFSGFLTLAIIAPLAYMSVGSWQEEIILEKTYEKLPHFYERVKEEESKPLDENELQQFATALRLKLQKEPNNAADWWTLGQIAMNLNKGQLAFDSFSQANKLAPENIEYKLSFARILMFSEDQSDKQKGVELLKEVLRIDHTNMQALSLLAFQYFESEEYKMAAVTWAMMLRLMPENDPRVPLIEKSIRAARDAIKEDNK
ncbi:c-type cytochrome biogenesis protein CcmI [Canicola haemoglobinophilus]|uniref:TPR repeat-containing cytochrome c-type biogenesis protein n=1 Tax=Canicola haemoglobinophilus TaxID=733 RepID=A0A1V4B2Y7_9PAST|nr:c-type cytochrome biogenesis protein CcmI [Canicola haemoglobinophilus]OOS01627.1 c-type cytochrome biogenesis protein CcmI [Canicola haemoglobinophilus]STO58915.1 TPR repeat-containing cytochrome c-type biogenesis protein [Canicola haemoglobinophilus]